jgi:hypothetical protein
MVGFGGRGARLPTFYDLCRLLEFCPALKRLSVINNVTFDSEGDFFFSDVPQPADLVMRGPSLKLLQLVGDIFAVAGNNVLRLARSCPALERLIVAGGDEGSFCYEAGLEKTRFFLFKKPAQWVFWVFLYICPEERVFRFFSVSRILLGASRH